MVEKMSVYILDRILYKNEKIEGDKRDMMLFGVERIVEDVPKYIIILLISILLDIVPLVGIVLGITILYKTFIGGAHARTNFTCLIYSTIYFVSPVFVSKFINLTNTSLYLSMIFILVFSIYVIFKIAPADTEEVPIINKKKRNTLKVFAFISLIVIYGILIFAINNMQIKTIILFTLFLINIGATKPVYKLLKCKYSYESEELKEYFH